MLGSLVAGMSFGNSDVGAVHCLSESVGALFDIPHGIANAILLPYVMEFNLPVAASKYARIAHLLGIEDEDPERASQKLVLAVKDLSRRLNIPHFRDLGIQKGQFQEIAEKSFANNSNASNPREAGVADYLGMLENAYVGCRLAFFDKDLKDFEFIAVKPYLLAGKAFVHRNNIVVVVGSGQHLVPTVRAEDLGGILHVYLHGVDGIPHEVILEILSFVLKIFRKGDFLAGDDTVHDTRINEFATTLPADLEADAFIKIVGERVPAAGAAVMPGRIERLLAVKIPQTAPDLWKFMGLCRYVFLQVFGSEFRRKVLQGKKFLQIEGAFPFSFGIAH